MSRQAQRGDSPQPPFGLSEVEAPAQRRPFDCAQGERGGGAMSRQAQRGDSPYPPFGLSEVEAPAQRRPFDGAQGEGGVALCRDRRSAVTAPNPRSG